LTRFWLNGNKFSREGPVADEWIGQWRRNVVALGPGCLHWTSVALQAGATAGSGGALAEYQRLGLP
jgi:hypothetical protein